MRTLFEEVPARSPLAGPPTGPHVLYVNDCKPTGCTIVPGANDSRMNKSAIVNQPRLLSAYSGDAATWDAMLTCLRENYAPFELEIVTTDPGSTPHYEIMVAGLPEDLGLVGTYGVAPFNCNVIDNGLSFTFANVIPTDALAQCWTASQESAHVFGLEHSMLAGDAMTYITNPPRKSFLDEVGCIGTQGCCQPAQECQCGRTTINSFQRLLAVLGASPPTLTIVSPADGEVVPAGFAVEVMADSAIALLKVDVYIDGVLFSRFAEPPYMLETDPKLALGAHNIAAIAEDINGTFTSTEIAIVRGTPAQPEPEPEPEPDPELDPQPRPPVGGGCNVARDPDLAPFLVLGLLLTITRRRHA